MPKGLNLPFGFGISFLLTALGRYPCLLTATIYLSLSTYSSFQYQLNCLLFFASKHISVSDTLPRSDNSIFTYEPLSLHFCNTATLCRLHRAFDRLLCQSEIKVAASERYLFISPIELPVLQVVFALISIAFFLPVPNLFS